MVASTRPRTAYRAPGIVRRARLLQAARQLLEKHELDVLTLADVAAKAKIPKGSAYHYYRDIVDLYANLLSQIDEEMVEDLRPPLTRVRLKSWADIVAALVRRGVSFFEAHPAARQLILSPKLPSELKLRDRQSDIRIGQLFQRHIETRFVLPEFPSRALVFFRAVEIADLMFSLSMLAHRCITDEMAEEAVRAMVGYLRSHIPDELPPQARIRDKGLSRKALRA